MNDAQQTTPASQPMSEQTVEPMVEPTSGGVRSNMFCTETVRVRFSMMKKRPVRSK